MDDNLEIRRGYPVYKLIRAVNRQYPNNGFINYVDVREDMYDSMQGQLIDEDLRDLINETIQEVYKDVAIDEVYSFPTVPGQNQYALPEDCDLRDIQEVTRTYQGVRGPLCPPPGPPPLPIIYTLFFDSNGGTGVMEPDECEIGETITLSSCFFNPPTGMVFDAWEINGEKHHPGEEIEMQSDLIATALWKEGTGPTPPPPVETYTVTFSINAAYGEISSVYGDKTDDGTVNYAVADGDECPEIPTVTANEGYEFIGWSPTDIIFDIVSDEEILSTPVTGNITYYGIFREEEEEDDVKAIITGILDNDYTVASSTDKINLERTVTGGTTPSLLTEENGVIVIGNGVAKVKVSAMVTVVPAAESLGGSKYFTINRKSGADEYNYSAVYTPIPSDEVGIRNVSSSATRVIPVSAGDELTLWFNGYNGDTLKSGDTYLTVEVVDYLS